HRYYLDGIEQPAGPVTGMVVTAMSSTPLRIGESWSHGGWSGDLDEVAVYTKLLTPTQAANHFNAGSPVPQNVTVANTSAKAQVAWNPPPAHDAAPRYT